MNWHRLTAAEIFEITGSRPGGLSMAQADEKLLLDGYNQIESGRKKTFAAILLSQFTDVMILILLAAAIISGIVGDLKDTIVILAIVILNAAVGVFQEYRAEQAMRALKNMSAVQARVIRAGVVKMINAIELVPGDVVQLEAGNAVPADLRLVESVNLRIEEAALTGESEAVHKISEALPADDLPLGDRTNMAYKGTYATYGRGTGVVVETGMNTELGRIAKLLQEKESFTPLQQRMAAFGKTLSVLVLFLCAVFFVAGWLRGEEVFRMVLTSISLAVAAIPEALPAVITISLALAAKRLVRHNTLIRKLPAVETLGSVTYICTDKTGTLTKNQMEVQKVFVDKQMLEASALNRAASPNAALLLHAFQLNNDVVTGADGKHAGDSTEIALMQAARRHHVDEPRRRLAEIPFDSARKLMTTFHEWDGRVVSFTKGAPDVLLPHCRDGNTASLLDRVDAMAAEGLRVLGFGYRFWDELPEEISSANVEHKLNFLGLAGMIDPPREEVFEAVAQCKTAGIIPVMITGDHPLTAKNIAARIGIFGSDEDLVVTGRELAAMNEDSYQAKVHRIKVYARVSPEQKLQIVKALQQRGAFVAMTGDGVNDAPSLRRANIGIAMGITGTDVAKEAAHMILLDDNFSTIVRAVREGRRIYDNILKFIKYLMTTNSGELWTLLLGPFVGLPVALLPIHILWINLISDGLPAIALSFEKAEKNIMNRPPRPPQETVFANKRGFHILWVGLFMAGIALSTQAFAIRNHLHWQTIAFNVLCLAQMAHVLAIRSETQSLFGIGVFSNRPLITAVIMAFALQFAVTFTPLLQPVFSTESLSFYEFIGVGAVASLVFVAVEIEKMLNRRKMMRVRKDGMQ